MTEGLNDRQLKVMEQRVNRARMAVHDLKPKIEETEIVVQARKILENHEAEAKRIREDAKSAKDDALTEVNMALAFGKNPAAVEQAVAKYETWCATYRKVNL